MKPRVSILDAHFKYRDSARTDVRKTWAEARRRKQEVEREQIEKLREIKPSIRARTA